MLCNNLEETKRIDNNEILKVKIEQYFKTIVGNVEKITKIGEVIVRVNKGNETVDQYLSEDRNNCLVIRFDTTGNNKCRSTSTTIQSSITNNNINYEQSQTKNKTKSMVSRFVPSSLNTIVPRSLKNYRMKEVINKFERIKRDSNSNPVDSSCNSNIDTPKCTLIILKPALDINNTDQHINTYTLIITKTDEKIIVDEENAKSIEEDRMLDTSVEHCNMNKNIDEIVKVTIMENVKHKIKNGASKETIDNKNLNDSVSINNVDKPVDKNSGQDMEAKRLKEIGANIVDRSNDLSLNHHLRLIL